MIDPYVVDVLLPDLVGHDRRASAFLVYLYLSGVAGRTGRDRVPASLQDIALRTGLSKSSVQSALRHLKRRRLVADETSDGLAPVRVVLKPWLRKGAPAR